MPNPKVGTVTPDVAQAVRTPRPARCSSASTRPASCTPRSAAARSTPDKLTGNLRALIEALNKAKPASEQGHLPAQGGGVVDDGRGCPVDTPVDHAAAA